MMSVVVAEESLGARGADRGYGLRRRDSAETMIEGDAEFVGGAQERIPAELRRARILASIERTGFISIAALAAELGVSGMTIRRDVARLEGLGRFQRTYGGAVAGERLPWLAARQDEPAFDQRARERAAEKAAIARAAATLIAPGESIGLDVGTSVQALAVEITARDDLRIYTNSLRVGVQMARSKCETYILGGRIRGDELSVVGARAVDELATTYLDRVFIGVSGLDANGFYDYSPEDTEVKRALIASAGTIVVLCDSTKFGQRALARIAPLKGIDMVVTDEDPPREIAESLALAGVRVIIGR